MNRPNFNIVGGGPVGLWLAKSLSERGNSATVYEEHEKLGRPEHCTGLFSKRINEIVKIPENLVLNRVNGAKFFSNSKSFVLERGATEALVVDRKGFDAHLGDLARDAGAKIILGKRTDPFSFPKEETVFVAEGIASRTANDLNAGVRKIPAFQYVARVGERLETGYVELHFLKSDFFAWVVPESENTAKVGVATSSAPKELLDSFMKRRFKSFLITERQGSHVIAGPPARKTVYENIVLVGDSAGQAKATTGGGVVTGLLCAGIAAKNAENPSNYEKDWRKAVGSELETAAKVRKVLSSLRPEEYDSLLEFARKNSDILKKHGDMDFHSKAVGKILTRPSNWPFIARHIGKLF